jgi:hypothetical protein
VTGRALRDLYAHYAEVAPAARLVLRDAEIDPAVLVLDPRAMLAPLESSLLRSFPARVRSRPALRAAVRHALDFRTWDSLRRGSRLSEAAAAALMTSLIAAAANLPAAGSSPPNPRTEARKDPHRRDPDLGVSPVLHCDRAHQSPTPRNHGDSPGPGRLG